MTSDPDLVGGDTPCQPDIFDSLNNLSEEIQSQEGAKLESRKGKSRMRARAPHSTKTITPGNVLLVRILNAFISYYLAVFLGLCNLAFEYFLTDDRKNRKVE